MSVSGPRTAGKQLGKHEHMHQHLHLALLPADVAHHQILRPGICLQVLYILQSSLRGRSM